MSELVINNTEISTDEEGRFSLNDLHKAAGKSNKHKPSLFYRSDSFKAVVEILKAHNSSVTPIVKKSGRYTGGTWVVEELAIVYMMWISPDVFYRCIKKISMNSCVDELAMEIANRSYGDEMQKTVALHLQSGALSAIEQTQGVKLEREYRVLSYRLDGYCKKTNTAYEVDEKSHYRNGKLMDKCVKRQQEIENELGCKFVRIKV